MSNLQQIKLISVGKPKGAWSELVSDYTSRLERACRFSHIVVKEKGNGEQDTRAQTSAEIMKHVDAGTHLVLLDETGTSKKSTDFAEYLSYQQSTTFILGSSYGVSEELKASADLTLKISDMVLAHEVARVLLLEQLYRAHTILANHPYHHS